jgi:hypothetical protein
MVICNQEFGNKKTLFKFKEGFHYSGWFKT